MNSYVCSARINRIPWVALLLGICCTTTYALDSGDYSYTVNADNSATITAYQGTNISIQIPSLIEGHVVTEIGEGAFSEYPAAPTPYEQISIPDTVLNIGQRAFAGCVNLHDITLGTSLTNISDEAFMYCNSLTNLVLEGQLATIGYRAFANCEDLQYLDTGDTLQTIGNAAFYNCHNLAYVHVGNGVETIKEDAFIYCSSLTNIVLGNGLASIEESAFQWCKNLLSVTIPHSVTNMGYDTFYECENLLSVEFGDGMSYIPYRGFLGCSRLTNITFGASIKSIEAFAFTRCTDLRQVEVPEGIHTLNSAFTDCSSLEQVHLPLSLTTCPFESSVFIGCSSLTSIVVAAGNPIYKDVDGVWFNKDGDDLLMYPEGRAGAYTIPAGTRYTSSSFGDCTGLTAVNIPNTMLYMGVSPFNGCTNLSSITVAADHQVFRSLNGVLYDDTLEELYKYPEGKTAKNFTVPGSITTLRQSSFSGAAHLESIHLPATLVEIGSYAFRGCAKLLSLTIPDSVQHIPTHAFTDCVALSHIALPDGITIIENSTFENCAALTSINLSTNLTTISKSAFQGCSALTKVTIPDSVVELGDHAFRDCASLERAYFGVAVDVIGYMAFKDCDALGNLYFKGEPPSSIGSSAFPSTGEATVYHLLNQDGWGSVFEDLPVTVWNPTLSIESEGSRNLSIRVTGPKDDNIILEQCSAMGSDWSPVSTNTLTAGLYQFSFPEGSLSSNSFYRASLIP